LKNVIDRLPHCIFLKNTEGVFLDCNTAFAELAGFQDPQEVIGKTDNEMPWKDNAAEYLKNDHQIVSQVISKLNYEEEQLQLDGTRKIMLVTKVPILRQNNKKIVIGILGVYVDITECKKTEAALVEAKEKAEQASEAKTLFLAEMQHDIRTPLSGIVGVAELLNTATQEQMKDYSNWLVKSGKELLGFLNSILESVNINSGDIPLVAHRFSLRETLESVAFLHQAKALEKGLNLSFDFDKAIPEYLIGDPVRIYRIILELLSNALKFTVKGSVAIRVVLIKKTEGDLIIRIEIKDTGIGISKDKQQDLLTRFNRSTASYEGIHKGSGLGLHIAKRFIDDLSAEFDIDSQPGRGTQCSCLFPLKEAL